jgi:putative hemolysin
MDSPIIELLAIVILVLANGFFAASEFALIASRKSRIKNLARLGDKRAARVKNLLAQPDRFLATIQIGITFIGTLAGVFGGATLVTTLVPYLKRVPIEAVSNTAHAIAIVIVVAFISVLSVVLGELIPKYIALGNPERIALAVTRPIAVFSRLTFFLAGALTMIAKLALRLFGISRLPERSHITEEEINILISEGAEKGIFDKTEQRLIKSVFDFTDIAVRQSMTPRVEIVGIRDDWPQDTVIETMVKNGYSRYPIYKGTLDQVTGVVYTKDVISMLVLKGMVILRDIIRKPLFVPDSMPLTTLLAKFQKRKVHIAIVLDEFGGTAGLITLEDILEEIVGEIQDEHDEDQPEFVAHSERVAFAAGSLRPDELNEAFGVDLPEDVSDTLAGLIVDTLGKVPEAADEAVIHGVHFKILEMDGMRIMRLRVEKGGTDAIRPKDG